MTQEPKSVEELILQARKICHDMNQPLTVIMARSELLLMKTAPDAPDHRAVEQIHQQAEKLSDLVLELQRLVKGFRPN